MEGRPPFGMPHGLRRKDLSTFAPLIFASSKRKNWKVAQALHDNAWAQKVDFDHDFSLEHLSQFVNLWALEPHRQLPT
jgi:hypothetical protein